MNPPVTDMQLLGQLLRCPSGIYAKEVGEYAFFSNRTMIFNTIDCLSLLPNSNVLEIGFGNASHLPYLFEKEPTIHYTGVETSVEMITEATVNNPELVAQQSVSFLQVQPDEKLEFNILFDVCFSVNTLYFLKSPTRYYRNIYQLLKPMGKVVITFIDKSVGEKAPFAQVGFKFYTVLEVRKILSRIGFKNIKEYTFEETLVSKSGKKIRRPYCIMIGEK
jgi:methyltransferase type 11